MDYEFRVIIADLILFGAGFLTGVFILLFKIAQQLKDVYIVPETKKTKANMIYVKDEDTGEKFVYVNPTGTAQTLELMWEYALWRGGHKNYTNRTHSVTDARKRSIVCYSFIGVTSIIVLLSLFLIIHVQY